VIDPRRSIELEFVALEVTNFLSYKKARFEFGDLVALVGPNASGKSNLVAALKLLQDIPVHGLPVALARRGGFDQLRHRSHGRPYDPSLRIEWRFGDSSEVSYYEITLGAVKPRTYRVKAETAVVWWNGQRAMFDSDGTGVEVRRDVFLDNPDNDDPERGPETTDEVRSFPVAPGQSAIPAGGTAGHLASELLQSIQTVEINPTVVGELQEPSSSAVLELNGSNATSVYELLSGEGKTQLVDELSAIVPGIVKVEVQRLADKQTFRFSQATPSGNREFSAKQMSDGTLRAFSILLALKQRYRQSLVVIEEPEVAIHLGALRTLVEILRAESEGRQLVITTHSADIVDAVPVDSLRVVWSENGESHVGRVADHTLQVLRDGLISPGQLLRSDSLDVAEGA
jgi:predicted ATPase